MQYTPALICPHYGAASLGAGALHVRYSGEYSGSSLRKSQPPDRGRRACRLRTPVRQSAKVQFGDYQANGVMAVAKSWVWRRDNLQSRYCLILTSTALPTRLKSPGRALSIFSSTPRFWRTTSTARCSLSARRHETAGADYRRRLLGAKRSERDARRPSAFDHHWRCFSPYPEFPGHKVIRANHVGDWGTSSGC